MSLTLNGQVLTDTQKTGIRSDLGVTSSADINTALAAKADASAVAAKVDTTTYNTGLATKVDNTTYNTAIALKANTADVIAKTAISVDGTLAGNSDTAIPSQKAVKTYVDGKVSGSSLALTTAQISAGATGAVGVGTDGLPRKLDGTVITTPAGVLTTAQVAWLQNQGITKQITAAYTALAADGGFNFDTQASGQTITVNNGLGAGWGVSGVGPVTAAGTATIVDKRKSGDVASDAAWYLQQIGVIGQTVRGSVLTNDLYWLQGGKA